MKTISQNVQQRSKTLTQLCKRPLDAAQNEKNDFIFHTKLCTLQCKHSKQPGKVNLSLTSSSCTLENASPAEPPSDKQSSTSQSRVLPRTVMTPQEGDPGERTDLIQPRRGPADYVDRALRRELRLPLRYRREGQDDWHPGETINVSESGLLFSSNELLEVDAKLEITFQTTGVPLLQSSTRVALIVRRVLSNWPETRLFFGARFHI